MTSSGLEMLPSLQQVILCLGRAFFTDGRLCWKEIIGSSPTLFIIARLVLSKYFLSVAALIRNISPIYNLKNHNLMHKSFS